MDETHRDRDTEGRARNARPRDGLGRPLPYGSPGVERQPEGVVRTPDETLREAQRLLDAGMPFHAHEVFEDAWKSGPRAERELWRGLAQLAVGLTHGARGNRAGGARLLRRAPARSPRTARRWPDGDPGRRTWSTGRTSLADRGGGGASGRCGGRGSATAGVGGPRARSGAVAELGGPGTGPSRSRYDPAP
ncbi:DUF309 domain-containing protein [Streptomyces sp. S6]|nr:DUF309 domain-containing protein [Streptomyces sp. S6]